MMLRPGAINLYRRIRASRLESGAAPTVPAYRWTGHSGPPGRSAFTMIELLLVISIMVVLAAIVVPKLRVVTGDRKVREAARVVESMFATARDEAVVNGFSGVEIVRNPNYANGATSLFRLRQRPPYSGDFQGDGVTIDPGNVLQFWHTNPPASVPPLYGVSFVPDPAPELDDYIQFNHRGPLYRMLSSNTFEVLPHQPTPPELFSPPFDYVIPFKIYRKPIRVFSSEVRVPGGQYLDLELSGFGAATPLAGTGSIAITFDQHGAIDRYFPSFVSGPLGSGPSLLPAGPLFLLVATDQAAEGINPLDNPTNLWVTVNQTNGAAKTSDMAANDPNNALSPLEDARALAVERLNTQQ